MLFSCGQREVMSTAEKCNCCEQFYHTTGNMVERGCITDHDHFDILILNQDALSSAFNQFYNV